MDSDKKKPPLHYIYRQRVLKKLQYETVWNSSLRVNRGLNLWAVEADCVFLLWSGLTRHQYSIHLLGIRLLIQSMTLEWAVAYVPTGEQSDQTADCLRAQCCPHVRWNSQTLPGELGQGTPSWPIYPTP